MENIKRGFLMAFMLAGLTPAYASNGIDWADNDPVVRYVCEQSYGGPAGPMDDARRYALGLLCDAYAEDAYTTVSQMEDETCLTSTATGLENCVRYRITVAYNSVQNLAENGQPLVAFVCETFASAGPTPNTGHMCFDPDRGVPIYEGGFAYSASTGFVSVDSTQLCINASAIYGGGSSPQFVAIPHAPPIDPETGKWNGCLHFDFSMAQAAQVLPSSPIIRWPFYLLHD